MPHFDEIITPYYNDIIQETEKHTTTVSDEVDIILDDIRKGIRSIDPKVFSRRNELLFAIRLVEAFRIFNWIKVCLTCGSYQSVFRELRFMLDGVAQACYIDLNHIDASLICKLEVYKALGEIGGFIGGNLFDRIKGFQEKQKLKDLYRDLSRFVHPSIEESRGWIKSPPPEGVVDSLKYNRYDRELFDEALEKSKQVGKLLVSLNDHFVKEFLKQI